MKLTPLEKRLSDLIRPIIEDMGFSLVLIKSFGKDGDHTIQVTAEAPETGNLGVDDCAKISRAISTVFDVEDPIDAAYKLEVTSPGIDRFLTRPQDFVKYKGFEVKVEIDMPLENGQKRFRGFIKDSNEENLVLDTDTGDYEVLLSSITKSKLVLTDKLIEATKV